MGPHHVARPSVRRRPGGRLVTAGDPESASLAPPFFALEERWHQRRVSAAQEHAVRARHGPAVGGELMRCSWGPGFRRGDNLRRHGALAFAGVTALYEVKAAGLNHCQTGPHHEARPSVRRRPGGRLVTAGDPESASLAPPFRPGRKGPSAALAPRRAERSAHALAPPPGGQELDPVQVHRAVARDVDQSNADHWLWPGIQRARLQRHLSSRWKKGGISGACAA